MNHINNIGRVLVSLVVVAGFMTVTYMFITQKALGNNPGEVLTLLVGALASNFTSVVAYWIGSSSGSTLKDEHMSQTAQKLAEKVPMAVTPTEKTIVAAATAAAEAVAPAAAADAAPAAAAQAAPPAAADAAPPAVDAELDRRGIPDKPKGS